MLVTFKNINMASRRKLKKTIQFIATEMITGVYFRCLMTRDFDVEKAESLVANITAIGKEFVSRASKPDGKNNPALVKAYYRALFAQWQQKSGELISEINAI